MSRVTHGQLSWRARCVLFGVLMTVSTGSDRAAAALLDLLVDFFFDAFCGDAMLSVVVVRTVGLGCFALLAEEVRRTSRFEPSGMRRWSWPCRTVRSCPCLQHHRGCRRCWLHLSPAVFQDVGREKRRS